MNCYFPAASGREWSSGEKDTMLVWLISLLVVSSSLVLSTYTLSISRYSLSKDLLLIIFSDEVTSRSPAKNLSPLMRRFCRNHLSRESLWNLDVNTKSYPSLSKSSISAARQIRVLTSVNVNFSQIEVLFICHAWIHWKLSDLRFETFPKFASKRASFS